MKTVVISIVFMTVTSSLASGARLLSEVMEQCIKQAETDCVFSHARDNKENEYYLSGALIKIILANQMELLKALLYDPDLDIRNKAQVMGRPLVLNTNNQALEILLEAGADPNFSTPDYSGFPLYNVATRGNAKGVEMLLQYGADIKNSYPKHRDGLPVENAVCIGFENSLHAMDRDMEKYYERAQGLYRVMQVLFQQDAKQFCEKTLGPALSKPRWKNYDTFLSKFNQTN